KLECWYPLGHGNAELLNKLSCQLKEHSKTVYCKPNAFVTAGRVWLLLLDVNRLLNLTKYSAKKQHFIQNRERSIDFVK
ncbi:MAG: hypothetical protein J1F28_09505, partial [Oscillospiraceae bacterium]|nr:hypothetical protein [Oscillospiraceae bacterium]